MDLPEVYPLVIDCKTLNIMCHSVCFLGGGPDNYIRIHINNENEKVKVAGKAFVVGASDNERVAYTFEHVFSLTRSIKKIAITHRNNLSITFDPESDGYKEIRVGVFKTRLDALALVLADPDSANTFEFKIHGGATRLARDIERFYPDLDLSPALGIKAETGRRGNTITSTMAKIGAEGQTGHLVNLDLVFSCSSLHLGAYFYTAKNSVFIEKRMEGLTDPKIYIYMRDHRDENTVKLEVPFQKDGNYLFTHDGKNKDEMVLFFSFTSAPNLSTEFGNCLNHPNLRNIFNPCSENAEKKYLILVFKMKNLDECQKQIVEKFGSNIRILSSKDPIAQSVSSIISKNLSNQ